MLIARKLKKENIAEYLLYMWQIEDIIRAYDLDIDKIQKQIIDKFDQSESIRQEMRGWYESLIDMIHREDIVKKGHLAINKNILNDLSILHRQLLKSPQETEYIASYYKTLPFIVELRSKSSEKDISEIETCLSALYGFLLMRMQKKEISGETQAAITQISELLRFLAVKYKEDYNGDLDLK